MPDKILGMGGYGCILSPAIVFYDSREVTESNKYQYVSKISANAEEEYSNCELVKSMIGPEANQYGIFPVDQLHCGVSVRDLGAISKEVLRKCYQVEDRSILGNYKTIKRDYVPNEAYISAGEIDTSSYLCAIQYPKYDIDLKDFIKKISAEKTPETMQKLTDAVLKIEHGLTEGLKILHLCGIMHLDIKGPNVGIKDGYAKFADWDFACFSDYPESVNERFSLTLQTNYREYYVHGITDRIFNANSLFNIVERKVSTITDDEKVFFLKALDAACLYTALLGVWFAVDPNIYAQRKAEYFDAYTSVYVSDLMGTSSD
jgi:serine/threonine protein kinase